MLKRLLQLWNRLLSNKRENNLAVARQVAPYRAMVEQAAVGMCIIQGGYLCYVNSKWSELFGYQATQTINTLKFMHLVHPHDRAMVAQRFEQLLAGQHHSLDFEFRGQRQDGETLWLSVHKKIVDYKGEPAIYGTCTLVSEHKQTEAVLRISEERLRVALETTQIGIWDWDLMHDIWYASPTYYTMLGYEPISTASDREVWLGRVHPEDRPMVRDRINRMRQQKRNSYTYEARMLHANGNYCWHQVIGHVTATDEQGEITRMVGIRKDVTAFKHSELELKKSQMRLHTLINTIPDLIWLKDPQGVYLQCNQRFELLFGTSEKEIVGKTDYDFVDNKTADFFRQKDNEARAAGKPTKNEEEVSFADGHTEILETIKTPVFDQDGTFIGVLGIGRDITEKKKNELELIVHRKNLEHLVQERTEELEASLDKLHAVNADLIQQQEELKKIINTLNSTREQLIQSEKMASLGVLSAGIAHEINNPLNFIQGGSMALRSFFNDKPNEYANLLKPLSAIEEGVKRATQIVKSLSHYSSHNDHAFQRCDLHAIIDNCLLMLNNKLKHRVTVQKYYTVKGSTIMGNEGRLHQALLNIIANAEQAIDSKGTISITTNTDNNRTWVYIDDTGSGMPPETINKIFDPFFTTKVTGKGTGLGLYITYNIVQEHNGTINYQSEPGKGTKVSLSLPTT